MLNISTSDPMRTYAINAGDNSAIFKLQDGRLEVRKLRLCVNGSELSHIGCSVAVDEKQIDAAFDEVVTRIFGSPYEFNFMGTIRLHRERLIQQRKKCVISHSAARKCWEILNIWEQTEGEYLEEFDALWDDVDHTILSATMDDDSLSEDMIFDIEWFFEEYLIDVACSEPCEAFKQTVWHDFLIAARKNVVER